jgi:hypothetical protein
MWKAIILFFLFPVSIMALEESAHLQDLKAKFPYALLTDDFGILNKDDLKINECIAVPAPFSEDSSSSYPYWQCYETKDTKMVCKGKQYSEEEKSRMTMLILFGERNGELNEFISRRPMKLGMCHLYQNDWLRFTKNEKYICIAGSQMSSEINNMGKRQRTWIFDRYKTKKGCDSYFQKACILKGRESCVVK